VRSGEIPASHFDHRPQVACQRLNGIVSGRELDGKVFGFFAPFVHLLDVQSAEQDLIGLATLSGCELAAGIVALAFQFDNPVGIP
jgi:hypothetical protein